MLKKYIPWSLRGVGPFLNTYGDPFLFRGILKSKPIAVNPDASTAIHSAVPHRYLNAYLFAIKSFLRYYSDVAVMVHDDGSLLPADYQLIKDHIPGVEIISRQLADQTFAEQYPDPFLAKVRSSYTSYLKLFDPTLFSKGKKIVILDTDTLFLKKPEAIIDWCINGGTPWFHRAPVGKWQPKKKSMTEHSRLQDVHIQKLIMDDLDQINTSLHKNYTLEQGFCSGFIGYSADSIDFNELKILFEHLFEKFGDRIFRWGAEQTTHGLILCGLGAKGLPVEDYFVFTLANAPTAKDGTFVHFVGENRFHQLIYPKLAKQILSDL